MANERRISLIELCARLSKMAHREITYQQIWHAVVNRKIPGEKVGGWSFRERDLPQILEVMTATKPVRRNG
jgi:hypothetical protein